MDLENVDLGQMKITNRTPSALFLAVALATYGCGPTGSDAGGDTCEAPCGTLVIVTGSALKTVVPAFAAFDTEIAAGDLIFLKLAEIGAGRNTLGDEGFEPRLAESWEIRDSLNIVFHLDPRATWHDGTPVTARDIAFSFDVYRDTLIDALGSDNLEQIASVTATDERTVLVTFAQVYPEQFFDATYHVRMLPAHLLDTIPREALETHPLVREPVGNGPFRFARWLTAETVEIRAQPDFFLGTPGLARVLFSLVADNNAALSQVLAGDADLLNVVPGPDAQTRAREADGVTLYPYVFPAYYYAAFNFRDPADPSRPHWLFGGADVRRAVTMALDRETIAKAVFGDEGVAPPGPVSKLLSIWNDSLPPIPYDPSQARQLLASLGWTPGADGTLVKNGQRFTFEITSPSSSSARQNAAVIMQEQLSQVGIDAQLVALESQTHNARAQAGEFDLSLGAWLNDPSPSGMRQTWTSGTSDNHGKYSNPDFDRYVEQAVYAPSAHEARRYWDRALRTIVHDAPAIWLMTGPFPAAVSSRFENVTIRPEQWAMDVWKWRVRPGMTIARDRVTPE